MPKFNINRNLHNSHKIPQVRKPKKLHANAAEMKELPGELKYTYIYSLGTVELIRKLGKFRVQQKLHSNFAMEIPAYKLEDYQDQVGHFDTRLSPA